MRLLMLLEEVRYKGKHDKLLFKILLTPDSLIISTMCRESKEPVRIDLKSIIDPYVDAETMNKVKATCKLIYEQKSRELK